MNNSTVTLFKVVVAKKGKLNLSNLANGFVTDFDPTPEQVEMLKSVFKPLPIVTLFSVAERKNSSIEELLIKQMFHYLETYGLESPGLFDLEVTAGKIVKVAYIKAVTATELGRKVRALLEANRPVKDVKPVIEVIRDYNIKYDLNEVANNELRVALYDGKTAFKSGDDAVRYICYKATKSPMLIKSKAAVAAVKTCKDIDADFLGQHLLPLSQVFNRHKKLIMACKNKKTASVINKISRLSKTEHVPVHEAVAKHYLSGALSGEYDRNVLTVISLRDKFKYLNLIEYKLLNRTVDTFNIRNGKVWTETDRPIFKSNDLEFVRGVVLESISKDLSYLNRKKILLDPSVEYGLPTTRKQSLGNLPYGTKIRSKDGKKEFAAGVYWRNDWGSETMRIDLDLTAIDENGARTGWGGYSAYTNGTGITYSGDVTDARDGATEFMSVDPNKHNRYGLMVNTFSGPSRVGAEIVIGHPSKKVWLDDTLVRERLDLESKQMLIGFIKDDAFVVYSGRLGNSRVTVGKHPVIDKGLGKLWTIVDLFDAIGINYDVEPQKKVVYDYDLSYSSFTFDKIEELFSI